MAKTTNTQFMASLEGIALSPEQTKRISSGIQEVVMRELAQVDQQAEFSVSKRFTPDPKLILNKDILINGIRIKAILKELQAPNQ